MFSLYGLAWLTYFNFVNIYSTGETIILSAEFENFTSRRLYPTAALYQRQYYYANERQKMRTVQLVKFQGVLRLVGHCHYTVLIDFNNGDNT